MDAYIVSGYRTAVGKANRGGFRFTRPDDLAAAVIKKIMADIPNLEADRIDDVIVGNAMPEAEQGLNMGRLISLMGLDTVKVPGVTVNRYCASGLTLRSRNTHVAGSSSVQRRPISSARSKRLRARISIGSGAVGSTPPITSTSRSTRSTSCASIRRTRTLT